LGLVNNTGIFQRPSSHERNWYSSPDISLGHFVEMKNLANEKFFLMKLLEIFLLKDIILIYIRP